jgi:peptide/nickel transport system ATP-binding protein
MENEGLAMSDCLLEIKDLMTYFNTVDGVVKAVDGVSFSLKTGETLGIVGESGSGKSVTALSILRLVQSPGIIVGGEVNFEGTNLLALSPEEIRKVRGDRISMIFQEPMTSLNPVYTIGTQIAEPLMLHRGKSKEEALSIAIELLRQVGVPQPEVRVYEYPHQFSGGMRQRAMIAMALACGPRLLIADEPTTAVDVTVQAQILSLMKRLKAETQMSIVLITHHLGVVAEMCDSVAVMYAGKILEKRSVHGFYSHPWHPYAQGLLASIPRIDSRPEMLHAIKGTLPDRLNMPKGCRFGPRCPKVLDICLEEEPPVLSLDDGFVRCWLYGGEVL